MNTPRSDTDELWRETERIVSLVDEANGKIRDLERQVNRLEAEVLNLERNKKDA